MVFVDFDRINVNKFYDTVDQNGVDVRLAPSEFHKPMVYKPSSLNESLVKFQQRAAQSYSRLEEDLIGATNMYLSVKQTSGDLQERITTDLPRIVPELSSVGAMATLAYLRYPQRPVPARLGISTVFALGTTILVFPGLRNNLKTRTFDSLPLAIQSSLEGLQRHYQRIVVESLVKGWEATEKSFYQVKESVFK